MKKINVLSLFNGMSFGMMALETLGVPVNNYYSSEIDKYANQATKALYPDVIQMGDVTRWRDWYLDVGGIELGSIDLLLAGFPCQAWSMAGKQKGDDDPRGALVHILIDIWQAINEQRAFYDKPPVKFMFENVKMKKKFLDYINELFGVEPVCINSALVSAQNRVRYYWTNIGDIEQPEDKGILLKDIIEQAPENPVIMSDKFVNRQQGRKCLVDNLDKKEANLSAMEYVKNGRQGDYVIMQTPRGNNPGGIRAINGKTPTLSSSSWEQNNKLYFQDHMLSDKAMARMERKTYSKPKVSPDKTGTLNTKNNSGQLSMDSGTTLIPLGKRYRKLTPRECMRLQTVPEHHINTLLNASISNSQLYKMTGNGWTHDVIVHIFKGLIKPSAKEKYKVIYCDPPWSFNSKKTGGNMKSGALAKYPTMNMEELKNMDVASLCANDCILIMWWVGSQPQEALDLCKAWGFTIKNMNGFVWNKLTVKGLPFFGMGFYTRAGSESALIAVRGKPSKLVTDHGVRAVKSATVGRHSKKPDEFRDDIVKMLGDVPRLEMFAREATEGWDLFGNEVDSSITIGNVK